MTHVEKIKQVFADYKKKVAEAYHENTYALRIFPEEAVLKILEGYDIEPCVHTLCDKCNKEFQIKFEETATDWIGVFARCPHCNLLNYRWLKIAKTKDKFVVVEKQKIRELADLLKKHPVEAKHVSFDWWFEAFEKKFVEALES